MRRVASSPALRGIVIGASVAVIAVLAGCGGGSDSTSPGAASAGTGTGAAGTGSGSFRSFGEAAGPGDRAAAAGVVSAFLRARADGDSAKECSLMSASTKNTLQGFGGGLIEAHQPCTKLIESVRSRISAKVLAASNRIQVIGMRIQGERGFVIYRDERGVETAFAVVREGSAWKVGAINGYPLP
jgi:hypothetical protein